MQVNVSLLALRPLVKGPSGVPVRIAAISNVHRLFTEWISKANTVGEVFTVKIVKDKKKTKEIGGKE